MKALELYLGLFLCLKFPMAHWWRTFKKTPATNANNTGIKTAWLAVNLLDLQKTRVTQPLIVTSSNLYKPTLLL
jgi:hypothetical protein